MSPADELAHYRTHENRVDDPRYRAFLAQVADPLTTRLTPGAAGLDYGCGPGPALAAMLAERGFPCEVWDPFFFPDPAPLGRHYDFVCCTEVVEHMHDPRDGFRRLAGLLAPDGILAVMTELQPSADAFAAWHYPRDPTHVSFFSERTMRWVAQAYGWRVESVSGRAMLFSAGCADTRTGSR